MGGGHVSRPDFGMAQPDPAHPLTEFYLLVQQALDKAGCFALPALYASLQAPARRIYPEEAREYLRLAPQAGEGFVRLQAAVQMQVLYSSLQVAADGAPAALLLTEECTRSVTALQLLPPFVWEDPLPPLPDVPAALTLQLTVQDVEAIDADPAALGRRLVDISHSGAALPDKEFLGIIRNSCRNSLNIRFSWGKTVILAPDTEIVVSDGMGLAIPLTDTSQDI